MRKLKVKLWLSEQYVSVQEALGQNDMIVGCTDDETDALTDKFCGLVKKYAPREHLNVELDLDTGKMTLLEPGDA